MAFIKEHKTLYKTSLSDLQGEWRALRDEVVDHHPFKDSERLIFQIDEAMSWEAVRDLDYMKKTLLVIRNIAIQAKAPPEVLNCIKYVWESLNEVLEELAEGKTD